MNDVFLNIKLHCGNKALIINIMHEILGPSQQGII